MKNILFNIFKPSHGSAPFLPRPLFLGASLLILFFLGTGKTAFGATASLSWEANTDSDLAGYNLYYGTNSGSYGAPIKLGSQTSYTVTELSNKTYYFTLTAYDTAGNESGYSMEVSKTFASPRPSLSGNDLLFSAIAGDREVTLTWKNPSDLGFSGLRIIYRTDRFPKDIYDGEVISDIEGVPEEVISILHTGLLNGVTYYFLAASYDGDGRFQETAVASAKIGVTTGSRSADFQDEPGGGCGMVFPRGGSPSGPGGAAGMLSLIGIMALMLIRARLRTALVLIKMRLEASVK